MLQIATATDGVDEVFTRPQLLPQMSALGPETTFDEGIVQEHQVRQESQVFRRSSAPPSFQPKESGWDNRHHLSDDTYARDRPHAKHLRPAWGELDHTHLALEKTPDVLPENDRQRGWNRNHIRGAEKAWRKVDTGSLRQPEEDQFSPRNPEVFTSGLRQTPRQEPQRKEAGWNKSHHLNKKPWNRLSQTNLIVQPNDIDQHDDGREKDWNDRHTFGAATALQKSLPNTPRSIRSPRASAEDVCERLFQRGMQLQQRQQVERERQLRLKDEQAQAQEFASVPTRVRHQVAQEGSEVVQKLTARLYPSSTF